MGRRTVGRRAMAWHNRAFTAAAAAAAAMAMAVCATIGSTGQAAAAARAQTTTARTQMAATGTQTTAARTQTTAAATPTPYAFAEDATTVKGTADTTDAEQLAPGKTYRSSIGRDAKLYYRLELDDTSNVYVSATAVPRPGTTVSYSDGVKVSVQDGNSRNCSFSGTTHFGATQSPHPIAAWASRETSGNQYACQTAGTYYVVVTRSGTTGSSSGDWDLELSYVSEPSLKKASGSTSAPEAWNSASPDALAGSSKRRKGGAGFTTASSLRQGIWQDRISPGQTLFYKVPVDWGQQLYATADLGSSSRSNGGNIGTALVLSLYNPVRGFVDDVGAGYDGGQRSAALDPLPPVAYENRYAFNDRVSGMRFAGSYYLVVHLAEQVADKIGDGPFGLTLRVRVDGTAQTGPAYAGQAAPRDAFDVPAEESDDAADGTVGGSTGTGDGGSGDSSGTMKLVAAGGIGTGSVLVLALGVWRVVARRRARVAPEDADTASARVQTQPQTQIQTPAPWERGAPRGW
ncbi:hypothetical protein [Streptomyces sp. NBC_00500]|uniref:hypothetical protein n=1 Tax=unclassified Streptomyces TaxID=2593676 RepID=UPI0030E4DA1D|nr:hypothetical protein OIC96_24185 [Streptomyces sp. NBC_00775]WUB33106.1 hypothetical protein OHA51_25550 [Streptomyces sp. NBC_00589]